MEDIAPGASGQIRAFGSPGKLRPSPLAASCEEELDPGVASDGGDETSEVAPMWQRMGHFGFLMGR